MFVHADKKSAETIRAKAGGKAATSLEDNRMQVVLQRKKVHVSPGDPVQRKVSINDDKSLEKEADVMGAKAAQLKDAAPGHLLKKNKTGQVVQRVITTQVFDDSELSPGDTAKMAAVKLYLDQSLSKIKGKIKTLFINVVEKKGTNPASTKLNDPGTAIVVTLSSWFVRVSSVGDICGMLSHEIGVHTLANNQMTDEHREEETKYQKQPFSVRVGFHEHHIAPWDNDQSSRQRDHINVVRDKGNSLVPLRHVKKPRRKSGKNKKEKRSVGDVNSVNTRAQQYAATILRLGDAIEADHTITPKEKDQRLHDLLNSYLFDYARILVTDDLRWHVIDKTPLIAQVFNWYKNVIIARHGDAHPWLKRKSMLPTASTWGLRAYLLGKVAQVIATQVKPGGRTGKVIDTVTSAGSTVLGWGGSLLGGISSGISSVTPGFVKKGAKGVGNLVGSGLRLVDHLYGEAENMIVPPTVKLVGKVFDVMNTG